MLDWGRLSSNQRYSLAIFFTWQVKVIYIGHSFILNTSESCVGGGCIQWLSTGENNVGVGRGLGGGWVLGTGRWGFYFKTIILEYITGKAG